MVCSTIALTCYIKLWGGKVIVQSVMPSNYLKLACMCIQNGVGNPAPVPTLEQCLIACESAPGCSSVTYSEGAQNCFLKGCPSNSTATCSVSPPCSLTQHPSTQGVAMAEMGGRSGWGEEKQVSCAAVYCFACICLGWVKARSGNACSRKAGQFHSAESL